VIFIRNKKKPFILIESLLAIGIIGLTLSTLLQTPAKLFKKNIQGFIEMELQREAQRLYLNCERTFKETLASMPISYEPTVFPLPDVQIELTSSFKRRYSCYYAISLNKENTIENVGTYRLFKICFYFQSPEDKKPLKSSYFLCALHSQAPRSL
jgi:hypothetical protein